MNNKDFENGTYGLLYSLKTDDLYISEQREVFLLAMEKEEHFRKIIHEEETETRPCRTPKNDLQQKAYEIGAEKIHIFSKDREEYLPVLSETRTTEYENPELLYVYSRLLITQEEKYLRMLGDHYYIVPADVEDVSTVSEYKKPMLMYAMAQKKEEKRKKVNQPSFYIAFTDLALFQEWNRTQASVWKPLKLSFWQLREVFGESGLCINYGFRDKTFLEPEELSKIPCDIPEMGE